MTHARLVNQRDSNDFPPLCSISHNLFSFLTCCTPTPGFSSSSDWQDQHVSTKMLGPFRVKSLLSPESTPQSSSSLSSVPAPVTRRSSYTDGVIRMSKEAYDELLQRLPEAVLSYIDEEDGEVVLVSDSAIIFPLQTTW